MNTIDAIATSLGDGHKIEVTYESGQWCVTARRWTPMPGSRSHWAEIASGDGATLAEACENCTQEPTP